MENLFRTKNEKWIRIQSNLLFIGVAELLIYIGSLMIKYNVQHFIDFFTPLVGETYGIHYNANFWIIIPVLISLAFMKATCPGALKALKEGTFARMMKALLVGFVMGLASVGLLTFLAWISGAMTFSYAGLDWQLIPVIIPLFIQCTAEEILLRGYVPAVMEKNHSWDAVCFVSGTLFIFHHVVNMAHYGFSSMFCLVVFLLGALFCLLIRREGCFWIACGMHTGWNYMQMYVFGVSNSGQPADVGLFRGTLNTGNIFYHEVYGYEGSLSAAVLALILIIWLAHSLAGKENKEAQQD